MLTNTQIHYQTQLTRQWSDGPAKRDRNMKNRKPYRSKVLKAEARRNAVKVDGRWVSHTRVLYH